AGTLVHCGDVVRVGCVEKAKAGFVLHDDDGPEPSDFVAEAHELGCRVLQSGDDRPEGRAVDVWDVTLDEELGAHAARRPRRAWPGRGTPDTSSYSTVSPPSATARASSVRDRTPAFR